MSVYIEYVILDNFIIDYIILYAVNKTLKLKAKRYRLFLGALIGAMLAVFLPLIKAPETVLLIIKLLTGLVMVALISFSGIKRYIVSFLFFITYTFVLGGCIIGLLLLLNADIYSAATLNYDFSVPAGVIAGVCFVYIMLMIKLIKYLERRKNIYPFKRRIKICYQNEEYESNGFIDTGNRMYDIDGSPVMIINEKLAKKMIPQDVLLKLYAGIYNGTDFIKKEFMTAHFKNSYMYIFKILKLLIYSGNEVNTIVNVSVGAVLTGFKGIEDCEALLHSDLINR